MIQAEWFPMRAADYSLTTEQEAARDAFKSFFSNESTIELVRESEPLGHSPELWSKLGDLGALSMGAPLETGGDGAGLVDLTLLAEQWGRYLGPVPLVEVIAAIRILAHPEVAETSWRGDALSGSKLVTLALRPVTGPQLVPGAAVADAVVALIDDKLVLTETSKRPEPVQNHGSSPLGWVEFGADPDDDNPASDIASSQVLATGPKARSIYANAVREWKLLMAAALVGVAEGGLEIGIDYAKEREAFGVPIGTFQAMAHPLVDGAMATDTARRLVMKAAWFADLDATSNEEYHRIPGAYLYAIEAAELATQVGLHTLGGVGFTLESDIQLFYRRVKGWSLVAGDPLDELDAIAHALYGPVAASNSNENVEA